MYLRYLVQLHDKYTSTFTTTKFDCTETKCLKEIININCENLSNL